MKHLVVTTILTALGIVALPASGATVVAADAGVVQAASIAGELAGLNTAIAQVGQTDDFSGTNIFWVLGGGLVALSLVARRISA